MKTHPRHLLTPALAALALSTVAAFPASAADYANARYGYFVSYPANLLVAEREADSGDGRKFHAKRGTAKMAVWAEWKMDELDQSPDHIAREAASDCDGGKVAYKVVKPKLVALSCVTPKGRVHYQKTLIGKDAVTTLTFEYAASEKARWDPVVARVSTSLQQGTPAR